jgi:hypothetical protein
MKYYILLLGLFLFACTDNISLQTSVTVNISKAGTLDSLLGKYEKDKIDTLIVRGEINEIDLITIKYMDSLSYIDLEKTKFQVKELKQHLLANGTQTKIMKLPDNQSFFYSLNPLEINTTYDNISISIDGILFKNEMKLYSRGVKDSILILSTVNTNKDIICKDLSLYNKVYEGINYPRVFINYKQKVNGYKVQVIWFPLIYEKGYTDYGLAILHFQNDKDEFYLYNDIFHDDGLYRYMPLKDGDSISLDYRQKDPNKYLADNSVPFFFQDVDFDGEDELLITKWQCGSRGSSMYDVYKMKKDGGAYLINEEPFNDMENGHTEFNPKEKTIKLHLNFSAYEYAIHTYKQVRQEKIEWKEPEICYKFELVRVDIHNQYTDSKEHKVYIKDGYKYKLVKDDKIPVNQHDK